MEGYFYHPDGRALDRSIQLRLWDMFEEWEDEGFRKRSPSDPRPSCEEHLRTRFLQNLDRFPEAEREDARCVFNCLMNYVRFHLAGDAEEAYMEDPGLGYAEFPGGNVKVPRGMSAIINAVRKQLPTGWIQLSHVVTNVTHRANDVTVTCENGSVHTADHVIVTIPLGYLKRHHRDLFSPALTPDKVNAIQTIPFGTVDKIFLYWSRPFWSSGTGSIKLAWPDNQANPNGKSEWYKRIFAFDEVLNNSNVLVAWISGDASLILPVPELQNGRDQ